MAVAAAAAAAAAATSTAVFRVELARIAFGQSTLVAVLLLMMMKKVHKLVKVDLLMKGEIEYTNIFLNKRKKHVKKVVENMFYLLKELGDVL